MNNQKLIFLSSATDAHQVGTTMDFEQEKRYNKIFTDKFFLLDIKEQGDNYEFAISGSTANVYKMKLHAATRTMSCDCPDASSHAKRYNVLCKHCCFILIRVLKMDVGTFEQDIFANPTLCFSPEVFWEVHGNVKRLVTTGRYARDVIDPTLTKKFKDMQQGVSADIYKLQKDLDDDDECVICFENLATANRDDLVECPNCHNAIHKFCMSKWLGSGYKTCVYCRSDIWAHYGKPSGGGGSGKYKNLFI